jgi:hypothetical protein
VPRLYISYVPNSFNGRAYQMLELTLGDRSICGGETTTGMTAIWWLFVNGKEVFGNPDTFYVNISRREKKIFNMIIDTQYHVKRTIWYDFINGKISKEEMLKRLEEELPKCLLAQKLQS